MELGIQFQAAAAGTVTAIRFYKNPWNTGTHVGNLWSATGTLLGSATFTNETAFGWQQANLASPVTLTPGTTYIVSYHSARGQLFGGPQLFRHPSHQRAAQAPCERRSQRFRLRASGVFPSNSGGLGQLLGRRRLCPLLGAPAISPRRRTTTAAFCHHEYSAFDPGFGSSGQRFGSQRLYSDSLPASATRPMGLSLTMPPPRR